MGASAPHCGRACVSPAGGVAFGVLLTPEPVSAPALAVVLVLNAVTFVLFGVDKRRAKLGRRRIPERHLLGLSWATGLVGGWLGMRLFRHKTRKVSFRIWMLAVSIFNPLWPLAIGWPIDLRWLGGGQA
ncbi:MAG: hypothetical protein RL562_2763 [Planctomycetota bacterium]|jgi:uncharacterized membrane protein YsdA (DUF1294 family)